jgi:putative endopeptidase
MLYAWQGGLGLPDREYYFLEDSKSKRFAEICDSYRKKASSWEVENSVALA